MTNYSNVFSGMRSKSQFVTLGRGVQSNIEVSSREDVVFREDKVCRDGQPRHEGVRDRAAGRERWSGAAMEGSPGNQEEHKTGGR